MQTDIILSYLWDCSITIAKRGRMLNIRITVISGIDVFDHRYKWPFHYWVIFVKKKTALWSKSKVLTYSP